MAIFTRIVQPWYRFPDLTPVRFDNDIGLWVKALADDPDTLASGVCVIVDDLEFDLYAEGEVTITGHGLTVGLPYYLSDTVEGELTTTPPAIIQQQLIPIDANTININMAEPTTEVSPYVRTFSDLTDVAPQAGTATDGQVLVREAGAGPNGNDYVLKALPFDDVGGVSIPVTPTDDEVLTYDSGGGGWVARPTNYRNMAIERILDGLSVAANQQPSGEGEANQIQIEFGPAVNTGSDPVNLLADGTVQFNEAGLYRVKIALIYGRTTNAGLAELRFRALINGNQAGQSLGVQIPNQNTEIPFSDEAWLNVPAGVDVTYEVMRDSSGTNAGGLFQPTITGGTAPSWNDCSCATIRIERWE
jgi:hypothetical protein